MLLRLNIIDIKDKKRTIVCDGFDNLIFLIKENFGIQLNQIVTIFKTVEDGSSIIIRKDVDLLLLKEDDNLYLQHGDNLRIYEKEKLFESAKKIHYQIKYEEIDEFLNKKVLLHENVDFCDLETGDLIFFRDSSRTSQAIRLSQWSNFSGVGIIISFSSKNKTIVYSLDFIPPDKSNEKEFKTKYGPQISELKTFYSEFKSQHPNLELYVKRLNKSLTKDQIDYLKCHMDLNDISFSYVDDSNSRTKKLLGKFYFSLIQKDIVYSSHIVVSVFKKLGLIKDDINLDDIIIKDLFEYPSKIFTNPDLFQKEIFYLDEENFQPPDESWRIIKPTLKNQIPSGFNAVWN